MKSKIIELAGWYGAVAILGSFALVSFGLLHADGPVYQLLNLTGAAGIMAVAAKKHVMQSVVVNIVWFLIAFVALVRIIL